MSEANAKFLDTFSAWLRSLGEDSAALGAVLEVEDCPQVAREAVAGGLNYLFKSLDLIPDGIDDIGYLDDAFVLRVACELAAREDLSRTPPAAVQTVERLAADAAIVREFLEKDYERLEAYVRGLRRGAARGRTVTDIVGDAQVRSEFLADLNGFARGYEPPTFTREEKNLVKLRAFFDAKLPR
ncbi:MAG: YkvA family protein [Myxococcales bacterium]|nr:YkvA family protein [Myxococcales bacterium]